MFFTYIIPMLVLFVHKYVNFLNIVINIMLSSLFVFIMLVFILMYVGML